MGDVSIDIGHRYMESSYLLTKVPLAMGEAVTVVAS